jgi:hypothetical protein
MSVGERRAEARIPPPWRQRLPALTARGHAGGLIHPHRALARAGRWGAGTALGLLVPLAFTLVQLRLLRTTLRLWAALFRFWSAHLDLGIGVGERLLRFGPVAVTLPTVSGARAPVSTAAWWTTAVACIALQLGTFLVRPHRWLPLVYALRGALFVQVTALVVFAFAPVSFPWTVDAHVTTGLLASLLLYLLTPWILGLTYDVMDFPLAQKVALKVLCLAYLAVAVPVQYLLHVWLLEHLSLLLLPVLYLFFGLLLDVLLIVALYAWGMSWRWGRVAA